MHKGEMDKPCIFFEQVDTRTAYAQGEPHDPSSPKGYNIWYVEEDGSMYLLGFAEDGPSAAQHYLQGSIPLYYKNLPRVEEGKENFVF